MPAVLYHHVQLADGQTTRSDSEAWRAECEARHVMNLPSHHRQDYLQGIASKRGPDAARDLLQQARRLYRLTHPRKQP